MISRKQLRLTSTAVTLYPHTKQRNKAEKMIKRKARRKLKENLKKGIDKHD